ncbi:MAG: ATPase, partial [Methanobrevibacter sp.]|nr:ATPase [Methanobrevibacter sp.]
TLYKYALENDIPIVIFGDMLATGSQCITEQVCNFDENSENEPSDIGDKVNKNKIIRLNLPASLSVAKLENKSLKSHYNIKKIK